MDARGEKLSYKIRESQTKKIPYTLILGNVERDNNAVSYRKFGSDETTTLPKDEFVKYIKNVIDSKKRD